MENDINKNLSQESTFSCRLNDRASNANSNCRIARKHRNIDLSTDKEINAQKKVMTSFPVFLFTICFFVFAISEILYSWEMYRDFLGLFFASPHWTITLILGLAIVLSAAYVAHLLSLNLSLHLFNLEVYKYKSVSNKDIITETEAHEQIRKIQKKNLLWGIAALMILLILVALISIRRTDLSAAALGIEELNFIQKALPVIIVLLETLCGIHLGSYLLPLLVKYYVRSRSESKFLKHLGICKYEDKLVLELLNKVKLRGERLIMTKDIYDSLYRSMTRSLNSLNYVDEIENEQVDIDTLHIIDPFILDKLSG
ncbi:MAG: hypothetical protein MUO72_08565 [Bacteroidales bacterium]|nr:hypothetical protein [Bacteroidales bacterium]